MGHTDFQHCLMQLQRGKEDGRCRGKVARGHEKSTVDFIVNVKNDQSVQKAPRSSNFLYKVKP